MAIKKILKRKRKVETEQNREVESEGYIRSPWNHGVEWLRREMIGKGSFGSVFRATAKKPKLSDQFPDVLAVKSAEFSRSASIEHEAEVLRWVKGSPFVIEFLGEESTTADNGDDIYNLLLEFASGGTLGGLIRKSKGQGLPESLVRRHTRSILEGVKHIHQCNYVHCDLKPENILLVPCASSHNNLVVAKVADLGLARTRKECAGGWRGTPMYTDPEAFINEAQDQYSDIWSVGCIVLEMLTGKVPWDSKPAGPSLEDFFDMVVSESAPKIPDQISEVARDFLKSCLATRCEERLTAEKLLLHPFVAQAPQAPALQAPDHKKVVAKRRRIAREKRVFAVRTKPVCAVL